MTVLSILVERVLSITTLERTYLHSISRTLSISTNEELPNIIGYIGEREWQSISNSHEHPFNALALDWATSCFNCKESWFLELLRERLERLHLPVIISKISWANSPATNSAHRYTTEIVSEVSSIRAIFRKSGDILEGSKKFAVRGVI